MKKMLYISPAINVIHLNGRYLLISGSVGGENIEYGGEGSADDGFAREDWFEED